MMNLIQRFLSRDNRHKTELRKNFSQYFFNLPEHTWLNDAKIKPQFDSLISRLPLGVLEAMMVKYPITFVTSQTMKQTRTPGTPVTNSVVVFPEFQKLLASGKASAVAYLAHEVAFILYELEESRPDPLMAEVEADKFVCDLGLTFELEELLLMLDETIEKRLRLTYLTINHFTSEN